MMLSIDLSAAQAERLRAEAQRLGLTPEELARAAVADLLASVGDDFDAAAGRVLKKNEELYRRSPDAVSLAGGGRRAASATAPSVGWRPGDPGLGELESAIAQPKASFGDGRIPADVIRSRREGWP